MGMTTQTPREDRSGRRAGFVLFVIGMVALAVVFILAAIAFARLPAEIADAKRVAEQGLGRILASAAAKAVFLLVMTYAGSLFASKGLDLYQAAGRKEGR